MLPNNSLALSVTWFAPPSILVKPDLPIKSEPNSDIFSINLLPVSWPNALSFNASATLAATG